MYLQGYLKEPESVESGQKWTKSQKTKIVSQGRRKAPIIPSNLLSKLQTTKNLMIHWACLNDP